MKNCDLIIHGASQLLTCASNGKPKRGLQMQDVGLIEDGAVAVSDGKILAAGKTDDILREYESENFFDARGKTVAPGFVECHTHIVFAGNRLGEFELKIKGADYLEILRAGGGILSTVRQTRAASLSELVEQSRRRLDKMLALGVTTCEVKTGYGLDTETELKMLEAILALDESHSVDLIPTFLPAHAVPSADFEAEGLSKEEAAERYTQIVCDEMLPAAAKIKERNEKFKDCFFVDVFCEKGAFNLEQSRKVLETAKWLGFKLKAHVDEFTNLGGARMAIELGAVSIDHLDAISDEEINLLADSETVGVVTPTVNFNFGSKEFADARKLIDRGCAVAISTDYNPGSAPCPSLPNAMAIACRYQKLLPGEAFNATSINAAFAAGIGERAGSLEAGKQADITIFDTPDFREIAYEFGGNPVETVFKNGKVIYGKK
jgi:imidazolonepropionase